MTARRTFVDGSRHVGQPATGRIATRRGRSKDELVRPFKPPTISGKCDDMAARSKGAPGGHTTLADAARVGLDQ